MKAILLCLAILLAPGLAHADSAPHANMTVGAPKPASTTFEGSPTSGMYKWINCATGDCTNLSIVNTAIYTNRDGVLMDTCPTTYKTCKGIVPSNMKMTDVDIYLNAFTTGSNLPEGVSFLHGSHAVMTNVRVHNFGMVKVGTAYQNGDCWDGERPFDDITFDHTVADHCADGGYDFKSTNVKFIDAEANDVDICFRAWGQGTGSIDCERWGPSSSGAAIQVTRLPDSTSGGGTRGDLHLSLAHLVATPSITQKVFNLHYAGASLQIDRCWGPMPAANGHNLLITYENGATAANTTLKLGPGCALGDNDPDPSLVVAPPPPPPVVSAVQVYYPTILVDKSGNGSVTVSTTAIWKAMGLKGPATLALPPTPCANDKGVAGQCYTLAQ